MTEKIKNIDWQKYNEHCPKYFDHKKIVENLIQLFNLKKEIENSETYNAVLSSIGNNHSGSYYPVVIEALPIIIEIAKNSNSEISRNCALEILSDLNYCFAPEIINNSKFSEKYLADFVADKTKEFLEIKNDNESKRNLILKSELIEYFEEVKNDEKLELFLEKIEKNDFKEMKELENIAKQSANLIYSMAKNSSIIHQLNTAENLSIKYHKENKQNDEKLKKEISNMIKKGINEWLKSELNY